jgi:hypothetical protein
MSEKAPPDWLQLSLKDPVQGYCDYFGGPFPRPLLIKYASSFGGVRAINELLNEHVLKDEEVTDWDEFVRELLKRKGKL